MKTTDSIKQLLGIPGIGAVYARRLLAIGITKPTDLLRQYIKCERSECHFNSWMKISCRANFHNASKCFEKIKTLEKAQTKSGTFGRNNFIFAQRLTCYHLLESPIRTFNNRSMAFYSNYGSIMPILPSAVVPIVVENDSKDDNDRRSHAQYERINKLQKKFSSIMNVANSKVRALQNDLGRMDDISQEFDKIARQTTTVRRVNAIEDNLLALNSKLHEMTANQRKLTNLVRRHKDTLEKQHIENMCGTKQLQHGLMQLENKMKNYNFDIGTVVKHNNEMHRRMIDMEKMVQTNFDVVLKQNRRTQYVQTLCGVAFAVLVLNYARTENISRIKNEPMRIVQ